MYLSSNVSFTGHNIDNGGRTVDGSSPGSVATYTCNDGYVLVGDSTRTCQATGTWSGEDPQCVEGSVTDTLMLCAWGNATMN